MNKKFLIGLVVLIIIAIAAFGYWYYQKSYKTAGTDALQKAGDLTKDLGEKAAKGVLPAINPNSNPMEGAPDTNPISKTNPFSGIKINPFK
mgnify:CR=1 FL=1